MRSCHCLLVVVLLLALNSGAQAQSGGNEDLKFKGAKVHVYKTTENAELKLHLFAPSGHQTADRRPAIVFFFGGGWKAGSPQQFEQHCRYLATRGMVAITADYRVSGVHMTQAKACVQDAKSAIRWVRQHAGELGIDSDRIAAGGGSAGGHIAACTAIIDGFEESGEDLSVSSKPNALVLFNPAVTLANFEGTVAIPKDRAGNLKARMGTDPINLSPGHQVTKDLPPTIMFFGTEDFLLEGAKFFHKNMLANDNRCELILSEGYAHGFFNYGKFDNRPFIETLTKADEFLATLGYIHGLPTVVNWLSQKG